MDIGGCAVRENLGQTCVQIQCVVDAILAASITQAVISVTTYYPSALITIFIQEILLRTPLFQDRVTSEVTLS